MVALVDRVRQVCLPVGQGDGRRFFFGDMGPKAKVAALGPPPAARFKGNATEPRRSGAAVSVFVLGLLLKGDNPQVGAPVIEAVPVPMVTLSPVTSEQAQDGPMHQHRFAGAVSMSLGPRCVPVTRQPPSVLGEFAVLGVEQRVAEERTEVPSVSADVDWDTYRAFECHGPHRNGKEVGEW
jgi:hypothetical protein